MWYVPYRDSILCVRGGKKLPVVGDGKSEHWGRRRDRIAQDQRWMLSMIQVPGYKMPAGVTYGQHLAVAAEGDAQDLPLGRVARCCWRLRL